MAKASNEVSVIDGSVLEGGGQILRNAISLAAILSKSICINNIRAGRKPPGLSNQHLAGIQLVGRISHGTLSGCCMRSTEVTFNPSKLSSGNYTADAHTAGSVCLLAQVALPVLIFGNQPSRLELRGGTDADFAPPIDYYSEVVQPNLNKMGIDFNVTVERRGYYPKGGGQVEFNIRPLSGPIQPIQLTERGAVTRVYGKAFVAGSLPIKMAEEMRIAAERVLRPVLPPNLPIVIHVLHDHASVGNCAEILLFAETEGACRLGVSRIVKPQASAGEVASDVAQELADLIMSGACVDDKMQDQLVLFMALGQGQSQVLSGPLTVHTQTAIFVAEQLTGVKFIAERVGVSDKNWLLSCDGIGLHPAC